MSNNPKNRDFFSASEQPEKRHNGHAYPGLHEEELNHEDGESSEFSSDLTDEIDHLILMHRDAHFGGDFKVMLDYYSLDTHIGIHPDFDFERVAYLADVEKEIGQDLAPIVLTGAEAESVARSRRAYENLKEIYALEEEINPIPRLIADLILSEEEEPLEEIEALVEESERAVPALLTLLITDEMYDPLFPGYGYAPYLACMCLGKIGAAEAVVPLFEMLSRPIVFDELVILEALYEIGEAAKKFLLNVVRSRPLSQDNSNAAFALTVFSTDLKVAVACFEQLQDPIVQDKPLLRAYLISNCDPLKSTNYRDALIKLSEDAKVLPELRTELQRLIEEWGSL